MYLKFKMSEMCIGNKMQLRYTSPLFVNEPSFIFPYLSDIWNSVASSMFQLLSQFTSSEDDERKATAMMTLSTIMDDDENAALEDSGTVI